MEISEFVGKEIFIVVSEEGTTSELNFYTSAEETDERLELIDPTDEPDTKVYHGVLTKADAIPSDVTGGTCYVIEISMSYANNCAQGALYPSECDGDIDVLAEDIEDIVSATYHGVMCVSDIDDIYILYGYEVGTGLRINSGTIDDEVVHTCKTIAAKAKSMSEEHIND